MRRSSALFFCNMTWLCMLLLFDCRASDPHGAHRIPNPPHTSRTACASGLGYYFGSFTPCCMGQHCTAWIKTQPMLRHTSSAPSPNPTPPFKATALRQHPYRAAPMVFWRTLTASPLSLVLQHHMASSLGRAVMLMLPYGCGCSRST